MSELHQEKVWIKGPQGRLAGELCHGDGAACGSALLLSPHPYMGGRMNLPLLNRLAEALAAKNITTLRFDYGGTGESDGPRVTIGPAMQQFWNTGSAPDDPIHIIEAEAARAWLEQNAGGTTAMIGYSFGSYAASRLHEHAPTAMVMIAPTIARHDYSTFDSERTPTLIICGNGDFASSDLEMKKWTASLKGPTEVRHFPAGDHFFRGMERDVAEAVCEFVCRISNAPVETLG